MHDMTIDAARQRIEARNIANQARKTPEDIAKAKQALQDVLIAADEFLVDGRHCEQDNIVAYRFAPDRFEYRRDDDWHIAFEGLDFIDEDGGYMLLHKDASRDWLNRKTMDHHQIQAITKEIIDIKAVCGAHLRDMNSENFEKELPRMLLEESAARIADCARRASEAAWSTEEEPAP